jgi:UDPglucose 6-dehydrogenase
MNIAVVGTGYVGLVSGTCFAETGNNVVCVDIDKSKVEKMRNKQIPIFEPGLEVLFERNINEGRLHFTNDLKEAIKDAKIIFLALPTPPGEDGSADLSYILGVAEELGKIMTDYKVIVDKSTVPVGTADLVTAKIAENATVDFDVVSNPEFLREGVAVNDFLKPDRVVIGVQSERARKVMNQLYQPYLRQGNPIIFMDERSAEMTKYAANSFLATKITFMNEVANLCELVDANVDMVRKGIGTDFRIGKHFLYAGTGYGGSCFPKDVKALSKTAKENDYNFKIIDSVMEVNEDQKTILVDKIKKYFGTSDFNGKKIALWGLAFKANTDDIREAPALYIIDALLEMGADVAVYDPEAMNNAKAIYGDKIEFVSNYYEALNNADALVIVTEWAVFRSPDFDEITKRLKDKVIFDGRNIYTLDKMDDLGYYYNSIGRSTINAK